MTNEKISIQLFNQTNSPLPINTDTLVELSKFIEKKEKCSFSLLEAVVVTPERITEINQEYLNRNYVTDIITFRYDNQDDFTGIEGTLYCCWNRIEEQSGEYGESPNREMIRVLIHGLLHLAGYEDQTEEAQTLMKKKEDFYLSKFESH